MKVFILHGWAYSIEKWDELCGLLNHDGIETTLLKIPGLTEPSSEVWDTEKYVSWLTDKLKNEVKPVIIGHSNGGRIALAFAQKDPTRPQELILIDSAGVSHDDGPDSAKRKVFRVIAKIGKPLGFMPGVKKVFYKLIGAMDYYNAPPNMKKTMTNLLNADKNIKLPSINLPVTLIWGKEDKVTPIEDAYKLVQNLPQANLNIVEGAKHSPQFTHPKQVAGLIEKALNS